MFVQILLIALMVHNYRFLDFFRFCITYVYSSYCVCSCHTVLFWVHVCCIFIKPFLILILIIAHIDGPPSLPWRYNLLFLATNNIAQI